MAQELVPDKVWLVCSKGMSTQQLSVTSQQSVQMEGGKWVATVEDRPGANFNCAAMVVAGAIIGALVAGVIAAATVATGGLAGAAIVGGIAAAGAATGAGAGFLSGLLPCICGLFLNGWTPFHSQIVIGSNKLHPILADSKIPCSFPLGGGVVSIYYSKNAADAAVDYTRWNTGLNVLEITFGAFAAGFLGTLICGASALGTAGKFSLKVIGDIAKRAIPSALAGFGANYLIGKGKEWAYQQAGWDDDVYMGNISSDYIKEGTLGNYNEDDYKELRNGRDLASEEVDAMGDVTNKNTYDYERRDVTHTYQVGDASETDYGYCSNSRPGAISETHPNVSDPVRSVNDYHVENGCGPVFDVNETTTTTGKEYTPRRQNPDHVNDLKDFGKGIAADLLAGIATDAFTAGLNNLFLRDKIEALVDAMNKENEERATIQVNENDIP